MAKRYELSTVPLSKTPPAPLKLVDVTNGHQIVSIHEIAGKTLRVGTVTTDTVEFEEVTDLPPSWPMDGTQYVSFLTNQKENP